MSELKEKIQGLVDFINECEAQDSHLSIRINKDGTGAIEIYRFNYEGMLLGRMYTSRTVSGFSPDTFEKVIEGLGRKKKK